MTPENGLRHELLKENGIASHGVSESDREALKKVLSRARGRAKRMKTAAVVAWCLFVAQLVAGAAAEYDFLPDYPGMSILHVVVYPFAIVLTVFALVRSWKARDTETKIHRTEVEARLAHLDECVRQIQEHARQEGASHAQPDED